LARWLGWVGAAAVALSTTGCFEPSDEAKASLAEVRADGARQTEEWNSLEDRLLGTQAQVHLWRELAERHRSVSALSCQNAETHLVAMAGHQDKQQKKLRKKRLSERLMEGGTVLARTRTPAARGL
jgi:hypothetical protein